MSQLARRCPAPGARGAGPGAAALVVGLGILLTCLLLAGFASGEDDFPDVCAYDPDNLVDNCQFDDDLDHWKTFVEDGSTPEFSVEDEYPDCDSPDCPALRVWAEKWFVGGIYQRISGVVPGETYWANVVWLVYDPAGALDNTVGRRIGIDPTGGTDPRSSNIVWSPDVWQKFDSCPYKICRELQVEATAQKTTITVFVRIEDTWKDRRDEFPQVPSGYFDMIERFWIDDVGLVQVEAPTPTPTPTTTATPSPVSAVISPTVGGSLVSNDVDRSVTVEIAPGVLTQTGVITYSYELPMAVAGGFAGTDRFFHLEMVGDSGPITHLVQPATITVRYPATTSLRLDSMNLYRLSGTLWVTGGITSVVRTDGALTSTTSHLSLFALLGETSRCYLPAIMK